MNVNDFKFAYDLRKRQIEAIGLISENKSVLCELPTGYGKTAVAIFCALKCKEEGMKTILLSPFKSLNAEHTQTFKDAGLEVVRYDSDTFVKDQQIALGEITIFTYEKFDSILRKEKNHYILAGIKYIIIDEIHIIAEDDNDFIPQKYIDENQEEVEEEYNTRGAAMEASLLKCKAINKNIKFLGLSATLGDETKLLKFLNMKLVKAGDDERPVKLVENLVQYDTDEEKWEMLVKDTKNVSTLVFCSSRDRTQKVPSFLSPNGEKPLKEMLMDGYGYHNAGLDVNERALVEKWTREHPIKCLGATSTLQAGVNFKQFKKVICFDTVRYSMLKGEVPFKVSELRQQGGRARGEEGKDNHVDAIYYASSDYYDYFENNWKFADTKSNFKTKKAINTIILDLIVSGVSNSVMSIISTLCDNGMEPVIEDVQIAESVKYLLDNKLIYKQGEVLTPSFVGKMCIWLYIDIETALYLSREIKVFPNENIKSVLLKVLSCKEFINNVVVRKEDSQSMNYAVQYLSSQGLYKNQDPRLIKCFYLLFSKFIEKETGNKFKIYFVKGDQYILKSSAKRIILAGSIIGKDEIKSNCKRLESMVEEGTFDPDQALLREVPQLGDVRIDRLHKAKVNKLSELIKLTPKELADIIQIKTLDTPIKMLENAKRIYFDNINEIEKYKKVKVEKDSKELLEEWLQDEDDPDKDFTY